MKIVQILSLMSIPIAVLAEKKEHWFGYEWNIENNTTTPVLVALHVAGLGSPFWAKLEPGKKDIVRVGGWCVNKIVVSVPGKMPLEKSVGLACGPRTVTVFYNENYNPSKPYNTPKPSYGSGIFVGQQPLQPPQPQILDVWVS